MTPIQELTLIQLKDHGPISAQQISVQLNWPLETVYGALVHLESTGKAELQTFSKSTRDTQRVRLWRAAP